MDSTPQTTTTHEAQPGDSLSIRRYFTQPGVHPFDTVEWELRDARIGHGDKVAFEQRGVEFPTTWSQNATNIVAQKYFRGQLDSPAREHSVKQMISRVAGTIAGWGRERGYFATDEDAEAFEDELTHILLHQMAAFNSPVWFNVGFEEHPQCSACQPYHALVSTPEGMVPIGELVEKDQVGREVYDAHGVTRVVAVKANGRKPVRRVKLRNGSFVEATPDHCRQGRRRPADRSTRHGCASTSRTGCQMRVTSACTPPRQGRDQAAPQHNNLEWRGPARRPKRMPRGQLEWSLAAEVRRATEEIVAYRGRRLGYGATEDVQAPALTASSESGVPHTSSKTDARARHPKSFPQLPEGGDPTKEPKPSSRGPTTSPSTTASSSASRTRWSRSSTGTPRRARSSAAARARASTCRTSAARWSRCPRAAPRAGPSRSCAAPTRGRARSSPAARRGARPRWSCSTSTTPTSATSSGARPARRTRPTRCATPASTCRSTARASPRSSTRTPTTRCASPTSSCTPSRRTASGARSRA